MGCSQGKRPPGEVTKAVAAGLNEMDLVDGGAVVFNESILMEPCLPRVRQHWERAEALLEESDAGSGKHTELLRTLREALAVCKTLEAEHYKSPHSECGPFCFVGISETGRFVSRAGTLAKALDLKMKSPREASTRESWVRPESWTMVETGKAEPVKAEITGLFGLKLGDPMPAQLVRKIDGWNDMAEVGVYCVTPPQPSDVFTDYTVELLGGPIHKINASRNGRGQALVSIYDDAKKELTSQFGPPTSTGAVDARGDSGIAWEQNLRYGGRVRMTLAMRKDSNAGYVVPGMVTLELQKLR